MTKPGGGARSQRHTTQQRLDDVEHSAFSPEYVHTNHTERYTTLYVRLSGRVYSFIHRYENMLRTYSKQRFSILKRRRIPACVCRVTLHTTGCVRCSQSTCATCHNTQIEQFRTLRGRERLEPAPYLRGNVEYGNFARTSECVLHGNVRSTENL